ncbi:MAG TPA: LamG-like jellyroll fold domain-containing protein [Acidimicrobiales bacterium]
MTYASEVLADSPVGYWKLDETSGTTAADSSGNGRDGTYNGSPSLASRALNGVLGAVSDFDGTNDYVDLPAMPTAAARTIEAWAVFDALTAYAAIVGEGYSGSSPDVELGIGCGLSNGSTNLEGAEFSGSWGGASGSAPSTATLHHVVATHDGSTVRLYLDGTEVASGSKARINGSEHWLIGAKLDYPTSGPYFNGAIGHVAIYSTALSSTRVAAHYTAGTTTGPDTGSADAAWSGWTATATGAGATAGTAAASWSGWTAAATVPEATTGTATASWSGWSATILVNPPAGIGAAQASWSGWTASIVGPGQAITGGTANSGATVPGGTVRAVVIDPTTGLPVEPDEWTIEIIDPATGTVKGTIDSALEGSGWEDVWSDLGAGILRLAADDPAVADIERRDIIRCTYRGAAAFQWRATKSQLVADDDGPGILTWSGPGRLSDLTAARVVPSRGFGASPVEEVRSFGWPAVDYDDSYWGDLSVSLGPQGTPTAYWYGLGDWPDPSAEWMWAPGAATNYAATGDVYFRTVFTVDTGGWHTIHLAVDDRGALWLDGQRLLTTQSWDNSNNSIVTVKVVLSAGEHTLAVWGNNNPGEVGNNPAGVLVAIMPEAGGPSIFSSGAGWKCLAYPLFPPGVTFGHAVGIVLTEAQDRGLLDGLDWTFDDDVDSNGDPWPYLDDVTAKVGSDLWSLIKAHVGIDCQVHMPGAAYRLDLYRADGGGPERPYTLDRPTDDTDPMSGVLVGQRITGEGVIATAAVVRYDGGWLYVDTTPDGDEPEEIILELRHITAESEAERVARGVLADLGRVREQIEVDIDPVDGELPWHQWTVGDLLTTRDTAGDTVVERVVGIAATVNGDYIDVTPTLKDRIAEDIERHEEWLKTMSDGAARGTTSATTPPSLPPPSLPPRPVQELTWSLDSWAARTGGRHEFRGRITCRKWRLHLDAPATATLTASLNLIGTGYIATASIPAGGTDTEVVFADVIDNGEAVEVVTTGSESFGGNVTLEYLTS